MAGALIEIGFGAISSSMPALNYILVTVGPRSLELWLGKSRLNRWFSGGSSEKKSFKDSFRYAPGPKSGGNRTTSPLDSFSDETREHTLCLDKHQSKGAFHPHIHEDVKSGIGNRPFVYKVGGRYSDITLQNPQITIQ